MPSDTPLPPESISKDAEREQIDIQIGQHVDAVRALEQQFNSGNTVDIQINSEMEQHFAAIRALKTHRNELSPISTIPPEITGEIFLSVKTPRYDPIYSTASLTWINISHICTHWRDIAIKLSALWDDPPLTSLEWTEEMFERSKEATLSIRFNFGSVDTKLKEGIAGLKKSLKHAARIGYLAIQYLEEETGKELSAALSAARAPQLGFLHIAYSDETSFPTKILAAAGTNLHTLHLTECTFDGTPHLPHSLKDLELRNIKYTSGATLRRFVEELSKLTSLRNLDISDALPTGSLALFETPTVYLSLLETLTILSYREEIPGLLEAISFSPSAAVRLVCLSDTSYRMCRSVMIALRRTYMTRHVGDTNFHFLEVVIQEDMSDIDLHINFSRDPPEEERSFQHLALVFLTDVWTGDHRIHINNVMVDLFNSGFPLEGITHVHLADVTMESQVLAKTFGLLPALISVKARGGVLTKTVISALKPQSGEQLYFKNVTSLKIVDTEFVTLDADTVQTDGVLIQHFEECLILRKECNADIVTLTIKRCWGITHTEINRFSHIIPNVYWDQVNQKQWTQRMDINNAH